MQRTLPRYEIEGISFVVDVDFNLLRHPTDDSLAYNFFENMEDTGKGYRLCLERQTLQPLIKDANGLGPDGIMLSIPYMVALDPVGVAEKFRIAPEALPESDQLLESNPDLIYRREIGKPASLVIDGRLFFADTANGYLILPGTSSSLWLNLNGMSADHFQSCYRCLYDPECTREYRPEPGEKIPDGIIALEIPHLRFLDSFNYRRAVRDDITLTEQEYFRRFPVRSVMSARIIPVEKAFSESRSLSEEKQQKMPDANKQVRGRGKNRGWGS